MPAKISLPLQNAIAAALNPWVSENRPISDRALVRAVAIGLHDRYQGELVPTQELRKLHYETHSSATEEIRAEQKAVAERLKEAAVVHLGEHGYERGSFVEERHDGVWGMPPEYHCGWGIHGNYHFERFRV